jgi:hypothetical protein
MVSVLVFHCLAYAIVCLVPWLPVHKVDAVEGHRTGDACACGVAPGQPRRIRDMDVVDAVLV